MQCTITITLHFFKSYCPLLCLYDVTFKALHVSYIDYNISTWTVMGVYYRHGIPAVRSCRRPMMKFPKVSNLWQFVWLVFYQTNRLLQCTPQQWSYLEDWSWQLVVILVEIVHFMQMVTFIRLIKRLHILVNN